MKILTKFTCCHIVQGINRSLLLDTQRNKYYLVPNSLQDFLNTVSGMDILEALGYYSDHEREIAEQYINFLITNELAFYCDSQLEAASFSVSGLPFEIPAHISNAVFEINRTTDTSAILNFINKTYIPTIQFIFYDKMGIVDLSTVVAGFSNLSCRSIQILFQNSGTITEVELARFASAHPQVELIMVFNAPLESVLEVHQTKIIFTKQVDYGHSMCGIISKEYFNTGLAHFMESQQRNTCLNRKIAIDQEGNIKNCPSMKASYGNISNTRLSEVLENVEFKKYWGIAKEQIDICRDCEFRHVCTDCRAYLEHPESVYSKPLKCGYNPYTNEWTEWSKNPLKNQAKLYYGIN